jgi:hypothetical protein
MSGPVRDVQLSLVEGMERNVGRIPGSVFTGTNADLLAAVAPIYLRGSVLDVTYGNGATAGGWWRSYRPGDFTWHDLAGDGVDFRDLPHPDASFDTVCFDPPYVPVGGEATQIERAVFRTRFGLTSSNVRSEEGLRTLIHDGLVECSRVTRGFLLVKCMEFVSSNRFHDMPTMVSNWAAALGLVKHDVIVHFSGGGVAGHNVTEIKRARRTHSYLLVFAKAAGSGAPGGTTA